MYLENYLSQNSPIVFTNEPKKKANLPGEHIGESRAAAFVRNVHDVDARQMLEQFAGEMRRRADAGRGEVEPSRFGLGEIDQVLHGPHREHWVNGENLRRGTDHADRSEVLDRVVWQLLLQDRIDRESRRARKKQRVAIGRGSRADFGADDAAGAGAVVDDDLLAELLAQFCCKHAAEDVVAAARWKRDDHPHRLRWICLGNDRKRA